MAAGEAPPRAQDAAGAPPASALPREQIDDLVAPIAGFSLAAHPVEYGNSGIMTFVVSRQGILYQKDLGPDTGRIARAMTAYNPDSSWTRAE